MPIRPISVRPPPIRPTSIRPTPVHLATAAAMLCLLPSCGGADETHHSADAPFHSSAKLQTAPEQEQESSPWAVHRIDGWEIESYDSLARLVDAADLVALGTVVDVRPGPRWVESEGDETVTSKITAYTVELTEVLSGEPVGETADRITLEFGPATRELGPDAVESRAAVVGESSLFILRRKGAPIPSIGRREPMKQDFAREVYRVVNSIGVIDDADGAAHLPLGEPGQPWAESLERGSYADAVARVRTALS